MARKPSFTAPKSSAVPRATPILEVMQATAPLASLARRLHESNARFATISAALPPALRPHVRPGPVDEEGWALLASNAAVAAKLRHLVPRLEDTLRDAGWPPVVIRLRVLSPG